MDKENKSSKRKKIRFYVMSLFLLFALLSLLTIDVPISFEEDSEFIGLLPLLERNILFIIFIVLTVFSYVLVRITEYEWKGATNPPYKIVSIKNENYEYLTFLTTYIIPLICIDLSKFKYVIVLVILLVLIGHIFVKMDLYYGNPTLALLGYRLYRAEIEGVTSPEGVILISKDKLSDNVAIEWIKIEQYVWVAKEKKRNECD